MSAQYQCDMCGEDLYDCADAVVTIHYEANRPDEYHFCENCTDPHIKPLLKKADEAIEERAAAWHREFERKSRARAADHDTTDRPG